MVHRGLPNTVDPVSPLGHIEVEFENTFLGKNHFHFDGDEELYVLAHIGLARCEEKRARELLGYRAAPICRIAQPSVELHGIPNRLQVKTVVSEKIIILHVDNTRYKRFRYPHQRNEGGCCFIPPCLTAPVAQIEVTWGSRVRNGNTESPTTSANTP